MQTYEVKCSLHSSRTAVVTWVLRISALVSCMVRVRVTIRVMYDWGDV